MTHAYATREAATAMTIISRTAITGDIARIERLNGLPEILNFFEIFSSFCSKSTFLWRKHAKIVFSPT